MLTVFGFFLIASAGKFRTATSDVQHSFVRALEFKHTLRTCNAYPYGAALDIFRAKEKLTKEPMKYKDCQEFHVQLKSGDKLEFKVGDANAGTFSVSELPPTDAVLLLVISRHDTLSTAVSFESHIFANLLNAQIAVIDTYKGAAKSTMRIKDTGDADTHRSEELRYNSVVAVNPGKYDVVLHNRDGTEKAKQAFTAVDHESYCLIRVGVEAHQGPPYPEELVVFPLTGKAGAATNSVMSALVAILLWHAL